MTCPLNCISLPVKDKKKLQRIMKWHEMMEMGGQRRIYTDILIKLWKLEQSVSKLIKKGKNI
jgi:hypothetical protein